MEQFSKQKALEIRRGLFLLKYQAANDRNNPPRFMISVDPANQDSVEIILPPGADQSILWSPGACAVARASQPGLIRIAVAPSIPNGSTAGRVQLISLSNDPAGLGEEEDESIAEAEEAEAVTELDLSSFRVLGHVAGTGDVIADSETWIAGPMAPSRIEGIAVQWPDKPRGLNLRYAIAVGGPRPSLGQMVDAGNFAGTRGRALPLVGATFEISGPAAAGYQLLVESVFLGSPQMGVLGQRVVVAGPTGREPMVGLRVRIIPLEQPKPAGQAAGPRPIVQHTAAGPNGTPGRDRPAPQGPHSAPDKPPSSGGPPVKRGSPPRSVAPLPASRSENEPGAGTKAMRLPEKRSGRVRVFRSTARTKEP